MITEMVRVFWIKDGERPEPPDDTSSGITMPVEELCIEEKKAELKADEKAQDTKKMG